MDALSGVSKLESIIWYEFKNKRLAVAAISHPGLKNVCKSSGKDFERLEFLGDRVLGLSLASFLYEKFLDDNEGDLAIRIATLAGTDFLINLAKKTKIIDCFSIPKDFFVSQNKNSSSIADMMEAVFGAIFLDSNFESVKEIILQLCKNDIENVVYRNKNSKSLLQEMTQAKCSELPVYKLIKMTGESHNPVFEIETIACGISAVGYGNSKKNAELDAADKLVKKLKVIN